MKYSEREIKVVIGASYGDEGKGLMTNYFCSQAYKSGEKCLTVLHNGGAQRGHTVSIKDSIRHVFHHLSSGTFSASDTYFGDTFIINPMVFAGEHSELFPDTKIYCSPKCRWSTPFDMMINQIVEDHRGENRHGSCGFGIWETIFRFNESNEDSFSGFMAMNRAEKTRYLKKIRDKYLPWRLSMLGVSELSDEWKEIIYNDKLIDNYIDDCECFWVNTVITDANILETYPYIVFEGAQGLLLSQDFGKNEKHTTPSYTGAENPVRIIGMLSGKNDVEVCYVTRTYLTRHGAGPFEGECDKNEINPHMVDMTNVPNGYQGTLRYGRLDVKSLRERINADFSKFGSVQNAEISIAVTHLNETNGKIAAPEGNISLENIRVPKMYCSYDEYGADRLKL